MEHSNKEYTAGYSYRNLDIWQRARANQREVLTIVKRLPREIPAEVFTKQMVRSAGSVGANIAEGHGRFSYAAFRNHLLIARGSLTETDNWLIALLDAGYIDESTEYLLHHECSVLIAALTRRINFLSSRAKTHADRLGEPPIEYHVPSEIDPETDDLFDCSNVSLFDEEDLDEHAD